MRAMLLGFLCCSALCAQEIEGTVYNRLTGAPIAGARVSIQRQGPNERVLTTTDAAGRFRLPAPSQNGYSVSAGGNGYLTNSFWASSSLEAAMASRIELTPQAVISGRIEDEDGFPAEGVGVWVLRLTASNDRRKLRTVQSTQTDDLGRYRLT